MENVINEQGTSEPSEDEKEIIFEEGTVTKVTDGDTIRVTVNEVSMPIRLIGIDTPEINHPTEPIQCYGPEAQSYLESLILGRQVKLEKDKTDIDQYDRYLRYVWLDEVLINEALLKDGYAFENAYPPDTKYQGRFYEAEKSAIDAKLGLWSEKTCDGNIYTGTYKDPKKVTEVAPTPQVKSSTTVNTPSQPIAPVVTPPPAPIPTPPPAPTPAPPPSSSYSCSCSKTCSQMASCDEAYFQLNNCGCSARDGDKDGVPCESICR